MAFSGIDAVVFGVADMAEAKRFLDDWGTSAIAAEPDRLVYETRDGGQIIVRPKDAADLPPAIEPGNTVREVIWGAASETELQDGIARLRAGGRLTEGADGLPRTRDPNGLSLGFRVSRRRKVVVMPTPANAPGTAQRVDRRSPVFDHAEPIKIGHVVLFASDFAAMREFYTERMGLIVSDEYPGHGAFMRCQMRGEHHNLFILNRPGKPGVNHVAFTVSDIHEVIGGGIGDEPERLEDRDRTGAAPDFVGLFLVFREPAGRAGGILRRRRFLHRGVAARHVRAQARAVRRMGDRRRHRRQDSPAGGRDRPNRPRPRVRNAMQPAIRRIIAVDAYRRRTGRCPTIIHSLGTGDTFEIKPTGDGFTDLNLGISVHAEAGRILLSDGAGPIEIVFDADTTFSGRDAASGERFSGRCGGGASVTIYDARRVDYFQYAIADARDTAP